MKWVAVVAVLLSGGCTPTAHRDGENIVLLCTFPCFMFYRGGVTDVGRQQCPMLEKVAR